MEFEHDFGTFVRSRLQNLGISQSEAAKRGGFSRQSLINWMNGDVKHIELQNIVRLAGVLEISPYYCLQYLCSQLALDIKSDAASHFSRDHTSFIRDVSVPDNTPVMAGQTFRKEWEIMNTGSVIWRNRFLLCTDTPPYLSGALTGGYLHPQKTRVRIPDTTPGDSVIVGVMLRAPDLPGTTRSNWKVVESNGNICFPEHAGLWCQVQVVRV